MKPYLVSDVKLQNMRTIYKYITRSSSQEISCAQAARDTSISLPTVIKISMSFAERGLLRDMGEVSAGTVGRRPVLLQFCPRSYFAVSCTYNGEYAEILFIDLNYSAIFTKKWRVTCEIKEFFSTWLPERLDELFKDEYPEGKLIGIGVALPVIIDPETQKSEYAAPLVGVEAGLSFEEYCGSLSGRFGCPVFLENDVNAAVIGEFKDRLLGEDDDLVYITVGKGVGSGLIIDGKLRRGPNNTAGEIGYMALGLLADNDAGGEARLESRLSPEYLKRRLSYDVLAPGEMTETTRILAADYIATYLALCIINLSAVLDVSQFVVGGYVIEPIEDIVFPMIREKVAKHTLIHPINITGEVMTHATGKGMGAVVVDKMLDSILAGS